MTPRCTQILVDNAAELTNAELVDLIASDTGLRFSLDTVNTRRSLLGLDAPAAILDLAPAALAAVAGRQAVMKLRS